MECLPEDFLRIDISDVASSLENLRYLLTRAKTPCYLLNIY